MSGPAMENHSLSEDSIYLLSRDAAETERLNKQHHFLTALLGSNLIHPSIPKNSILAVADLGTGTGIWLEELAKNLPAVSPLDLQGFDISPSQFPPSHELHGPRNERIPLAVHDSLKPYPSEHQGRYDLVHIRLLTAGLKRDDYATVLKNARDLLKPHGYIQWEEVDETAFCTDKVPELPAITQIRQSVIKAMLAMGLSPFAPKRVHEEISKGGFENIRCETYTVAGREDLRQVATKWVVNVMQALLTPALMITGEAKNKDEAEDKVEALVDEFEMHCENALPLINFSIVVAQRLD
ncbi:hypothetical protein N7532_008521 [Penicillium argentinense]|uniref:LaeA-like methyltransferase n=1 Tax=Penicillium argentinense TaxID=1131581 RepID=A0A9W9K2K9_9EURO|nr:uncharacterized protein N7532_008521 [Penicillium argentinense]KAJ5089837.1 hypothetical protein N7532_008521 [Penicillium argentinense]